MSACSSSKKQERPDEERLVDEEKSPEGRTNRADEYFSSGNEKLDARQWDAAISLYKKALEEDEKRWDIWMNKAIAESSKPDFQAAIASMEQALHHGGDREPVVYFNLGNIYQNRGMYRQSIKAYRAGLAYRGEPHLPSLHNIGSGLIFLGDYEGARATYDHILSIDPDDVRARLGHALILDLEGKPKKALEAYQEIVRLDPKFAQAYLNKSRVHAKLDQHREAVSSVERFLELAPDSPYADRAEKLLEQYRKELPSQPTDAQ
jgi:tetratricopeptide (TPR) repeat protein